MVKEAEANAEADKQRREQVETRNQADGLIHQVEKNLKEHGDKMPAQEKGEAEAAIAAATLRDGRHRRRGAEAGHRAAQPGGDEDRRGDVQGAAGRAGSRCDGPGWRCRPGGGAGGKPDDKVVDAEFEEVDEKKKKSA